MPQSMILETSEQITREVRQLMRKRPVSKGNRSDYSVLAFQLENAAKDLRRRAAEARSFQE
jgi:hypothetical protein